MHAVVAVHCENHFDLRSVVGSEKTQSIVSMEQLKINVRMEKRCEAQHRWVNALCRIDTKCEPNEYSEAPVEKDETKIVLGNYGWSRNWWKTSEKNNVQARTRDIQEMQTYTGCMFPAISREFSREYAAEWERERAASAVCVQCIA